MKTSFKSLISLPAPTVAGRMNVEEAIKRRRSTRDYANRSISLKQLSQILWAAQGITNTRYSLRAAPSAGALYPLEIYVALREGGVSNLAAGLYHYEVEEHTISLVKSGDFSIQLQSAALDQGAVGQSAMIIIITAIFSKTMAKYGERGNQYVLQESGHVAENIYLEATALGLGTVTMGAFDENKVRNMIGAESFERPLCLQPIGVPL
jgi:SagB-type dehydrogenase family enzyme